MAVVRFRCSQLSTEHLADSLFCSVGGKSLSQCKVGRITYGDWRNEDVVVVRTNDEEWEVNCHGGLVPVRRIFSDLKAAGIQNFDEQVPPDSVSSREEWQQLLLRSKTIATADLLLSQPQALQDFSNSLDACRDSVEATQLVDRLLSWKPLADHLINPWIVAIVGKPNAGKSSLLNAIVGYQRSIVFDQPGTTRDLVQCDVIIGGWPFRLVDTAGIRGESKDDIEAQGIEAARMMIQSADLCMVVSDQNAGWSHEDRQLVDLALQRIPVCVIRNKCDLPTAITDTPLEFAADLTSFNVSSTTSEGIRPVIDWISMALVPLSPKPEEPLPVLRAICKVCAEFCESSDLESFKLQIRNVCNSICERERQIDAN